MTVIDGSDDDNDDGDLLLPLLRLLQEFARAQKYSRSTTMAID